MTTVLWIVVGTLCALVPVLAFLVLGVLRALGVLTWRLDQLQATTPGRIARDGLRVGEQAPDFTLPLHGAHDVSLREFRGRRLLLVFTQSGCGPCHDIVPELNRLHDADEYQVIAINNGAPDATATWAADTGARFPVLAQDRFSISKRYQVFATPFAFLIDEQGVVRSKGTIAMRQHLGYVLSGAGQTGNRYVVKLETEASSRAVVTEPVPTPATSMEASHV
jgi:methylamine dehydrogenase accessory protein MauD